MLATDDIPFFEIERGGDVTYHGPGQLVGYPIFLLRDDERDLHVYLRNLEESLIRALARFDLAGERKSGWTGVWTAGGARKLASIGVAVKRWVTMHGFALNVSTDLARFAAINPCGLDAAVMGSMSGELGRPVAMAAVKAAVRDAFAEVFARKLDWRVAAQSVGAAVAGAAAAVGARAPGRGGEGRGGVGGQRRPRTRRARRPRP